MAKRLTDSEKWNDPWFADLPSKYKLFWLYLVDNCDHAGIWKVNFKNAIFFIGENLEIGEVKRMLKDRIIFLNDEYWYLKKFIKFQYKADITGLNPKNRTHSSVLKILNEFDRFKPLVSPLLGVKDKDKDKDKNINSYNYNILKEKKEKKESEDTLVSNEKNIYWYLENEKLCDAIIKNQENKIKNISELEIKLYDFKEHCDQLGQFSKTPTDFRSHFRFWNLKNKKNDKGTENYSFD